MALDTAAAPVSQRWLAESLGVNRTVMGRLVDKLERDGLVERERSPTDRRAYALRATAAGLEAVARAAPELDRSDAAADREPLARRARAAQRAAAQAARRRPRPPAAGRPRRPQRLPPHAGAPAHALTRRRRARPLGIEVRHFGAMAVASAIGPCSQHDVARALGVTPPVIVPIVDELEALELVRRERNPADRRSYALRLTPAGERTLVEARERLEQLPAGVLTTTPAAPSCGRCCGACWARTPKPRTIRAPTTACAASRAGAAGPSPSRASGRGGRRRRRRSPRSGP